MGEVIIDGQSKKGRIQVVVKRHFVYWRNQTQYKPGDELDVSEQEYARAERMFERVISAKETEPLKEKAKTFSKKLKPQKTRKVEDSQMENKNL